ncbi:MAG: FkbM family methyltransferase, partial [Isosphaeraceae bacterium]
AVAYFVSVLPLIGFVLYVERRVLHLERSPWRDVFLRLALPIAGEAICLLLLRGHVSALPSLVGLLCLSIAAMPLAYLCLLAPAEDRRIMRELFGAPRWAGSSSNVMPPILFRIVWPLTWPIRLYLRWMPVKRGTQRLYRALDRFIRSVGTGTFRAVLPRGRLAELRFDEVVGRTYLIRGAFEAGESELLHRYAKVGTTAIDVGANVGLLTMALADGVGNRGCVWAFEPFAENFDRLRQNMSLNGFEHVEVFQCAVSDSDNGAWLNVADDPAYHSLAGVQEDRATGDQIKVATTTLDDTWRARKCPFVSVIKIDTEGTEPTVVAGALALITNCKPVLVVETLSGSAAGAVGELLRPYGYAEVRSLHVQRITRVFSPRAVVCVASSEIVEPRSENGQRGTPQTCAS